MEELRRRMASAKSWGVDDVALVTPAEVKELVPYIDESVIVGGFYSEGVGVVDSLRAGTLMREQAQEAGALTVSANTEVLGIDVENGRVKRVRTDRGDVEAEYVVIACGVWSPRIARMAGRVDPAHPGGPPDDRHRPGAALRGREERHRVPDRARHGHEHVRAPGRQRPRGRLLRAPPDPARPRRDPLDRGVRALPHRAAVHPGRLRPADGARARADAGDRRRRVGGHQVRDQRPALAHARRPADPRRDARGERASGRPRRSGSRRARASAARWPSGWSRASPRSTCRPPTSRASTSTRRPSRTCRPRAPRASTRPTGSSTRASSGSRTAACGCPPSTSASASSAPSSTRPPAGSARTGTSRTAGLLEEYADQSSDREAEWDSRWWSPIINAEHLAMRDRAAMFDLTAFCVFDVVGPGALECVQKVSMRQMDVKLGKVVYTPVLTPRGGFRSDLTVMRLGDEHFRVVTGGAHGMADLKWYRDHLPEDGTAQIFDLTSSWCTLGLWGPRARDILREHHERRRLARGLPVRHAAARSRWGRCACSRRASPTWATSAGSCTCRSSRARSSGTWSGRPGEPHGIVPAGIGVYGTTGRLEKCYRAFGFELDGEYDVVEAGMAWGKVKDQDFVGKEAHVRHREEDPAAVMCTLTVDDHTPPSGRKRYMLGGEPIVTRDGEPLVDAKGRRSFVTSAGAGPSVGKHILMSYLPPEHAQAWASELAVRVHERALPGHRRGAPTRRRSSTPTTSASRPPAPFRHEDPRLRQARAAHRRQDGADRRRAGARDAPPRLHDQPARGVRRRGGGAARGAARRRGHRAHARARRGRGADPRLARDRRRPRHPAGDRRRGVGPAGHRRRDRRDVEAEEPRAATST